MSQSIYFEQDENKDNWFVYHNGDIIGMIETQDGVYFQPSFNGHFQIYQEDLLLIVNKLKELTDKEEKAKK